MPDCMTDCMTDCMYCTVRPRPTAGRGGLRAVVSGVPLSGRGAPHRRGVPGALCTRRLRLPRPGGARGVGVDHKAVGVDHKAVGVDHKGVGVDHKGVGVDHKGVGVD
eukprot:4428347-Pyramimonas_sp.AAC.1